MRSGGWEGGKVLAHLVARGFAKDIEYLGSIHTDDGPLAQLSVKMPRC